MAETLNAELVKEFVSNAHGNFEKVKELLDNEPGLLNAAWDWGGGDWETALGAASHMGRKDIALYLLERGARIDLFSAAMLGKLEIVRSMLSDNPKLKDALGPHTIPLMQHAKAGGDEAKAVVDFLETLG
ncbi:MAG: ankyrin repeat domain-containing protein [Candidatus Pristimantibacillus sp.]